MEREVTFKIPSVCTVQRVKQLLEATAPIFGLVDKRIEHVKVVTSHIVFSVLCEIVSNFKEHSQDETDSILVATGDKNKFEVVCADTGIGMISSMATVLRNSPSISIRDFDVLEIATRQGMTSKHDTNHMGYGLWLISEFVNLANGELHMYSEGAYYVNQCGKIKKGTCGFWQGTIIYVSLPLNNVSSLQKWQDNLAELYEDIKINCI